MQAVILAAGESSRFYPFNQEHKSLIKILGKTIIEHTLLSVAKSGIKDVIIIVGKESKVESLTQNLDLGLKIKYIIQPEATGMGEAILLAEKFIKSDFFLLHAHHVDFLRFKKMLEEGRKKDSEIVLLAKKFDALSLRKMGVLKIAKDKVLEVVEKPKKGEEPSSLGVIGIYLLNKLFAETLARQPKEHYSFEKSISQFTKRENVRFVATNIENVSLKYPWEILIFKNHLLKGIKRRIAKTAAIEKSAKIIGNVYLCEGARVMENAVVKGPSYIGRNTFVGNNAVLRDGVDLEENTVVGANMEVKNSILMENSKVHSGFVGDSIIGKDCRIGAGFNTANVRLDRTTVKSVVKNEKIDTGLRSLGVMVGDNTHIGIKSSTMPGVIIGRSVMIGSNTTVMKNISDNIKYYTKFKEIIEKKKKIILFDIDYTLFDTKSFKDSQLTKYTLYKETVEIINYLSKIADLGVFSKGEVTFQNTKLVKTSINKFFRKNNVHIFEDKDINLKKVSGNYQDRTIFLVDDKLTFLYNAKISNPSVIAIWIKRGPYAEKQQPIKDFSPDAIINNLSELNEIVETN